MGVGSGLPPDELYRIARRLAWRYRRVPGVDLEEAAQAAVTQVLEALAQLNAPVLDVRAYAQADQSFTRASCVGCGMCAHMCPRGVLKLESPSRRRLSVIDS